LASNHRAISSNKRSKKRGNSGLRKNKRQLSSVQAAASLVWLNQEQRALSLAGSWPAEVSLIN